MALLDDARTLLGELFLIGLDGKELSDDTSAFLSQARIGGVVLYEHNYESPKQIAAMITQIQGCKTGLPLWISTDHEGGRIQCFQSGFTRIPPAAKIGAVDSPKLTFDIAEMMGKELSAVGVNLCFAPVADIHSNPANPIIGDRAFGTTEEQATKHVTAMVRGLLVAGVQPCVKHFPGHGDTSVDSHLELPKVDTPASTLKARELAPFHKAFRSRCSMVMTAHLMATQLDPKLPATLSSKILKDLLRGEMRFSKLIIADDLEMKAISDHWGEAEAPKLALEAGCDILIYRTEKGARRGYASLMKALDEERLDPKVVLEAAQRCKQVKHEALAAYKNPDLSQIASVVGIPEHAALVERVG